MPQIGRPTTKTQRRLQNVTMAPERSRAKADPRLNPNRKPQINKKELLDKVTGFQEKSIVNTAVGNKGKNQLGKDEFLKLLTYQLQNQDPMNPMEQDKFTAELAQFSQLEQLANLNTKFDKINKNQEIKDKSFAASFLGKQVVTAGNSLKVENTKPADVFFTLPQKAKKVIARIFDGNGGMVGEMNMDNMNQGAQTMRWNKKALDGYPVSEGVYSVQVLAWDDNYTPIPVETNAVGLVQSVSFEEGEAMLFVDGKKVSLRDVKSFHIAQKDLSMHNDRRSKKSAQAMAPKKQAINNFEQMNKSIYD